MTYELAKELKDAGFPQELKDSVHLNTYFDEDGNLNVWAWANDVSINELTKCPNLSELIEACEPNFICLRKTAPKRGSLKARWIAEGWEYLMDATTEPQKTLRDTPEEAVARLWLALNKK